MSPACCRRWLREVGAEGWKSSPTVYLLFKTRNRRRIQGRTFPQRLSSWCLTYYLQMTSFVHLMGTPDLFQPRNILVMFHTHLTPVTFHALPGYPTSWPILKVTPTLRPRPIGEPPVSETDTNVPHKLWQPTRASISLSLSPYRVQELRFIAHLKTGNRRSPGAMDYNLVNSVLSSTPFTVSPSHIIPSPTLRTVYKEEG